MRGFRWYLPLVALACGWPALAWAAPRELKRTFPVQPGCTLKLDTFRGYVAIEESEASEIRLTLVIEAEAATDGRAQRLQDEVQVDLVARDNAVEINARRSRPGLRVQWDNDERVDLYYQLSVPRHCHLELKAREGGFSVGNLAGRLSARLEQGTIFFRRIEGSIDARLDFGDLVISRCSGAVTARVLRGSIRTGTIGGPVDIRNSHGDVEVMMALAGAAVAAEVGQVTIGFGPAVRLDSRVTAGAGNILVKVHRDAACRIEASCSWGRIENSLPLQVDSARSSRRRLVGMLKQGGPLIAVHASGGSVQLTDDVVLLGWPDSGSTAP